MELYYAVTRSTCLNARVCYKGLIEVIHLAFFFKFNKLLIISPHKMISELY
jgi:hypothetical protein